MKKQIIKILAGGGLLAGSAILAGCDITTVNTTIQRYIGGNRGAIDQAEEAKIAVENLNPVFDSEEEAVPQDSTAGQVNRLLVDGLKKTFVDAKLVAIQNEGKTPFMMRYLVKRRINQEDGETLQKALLELDSRAKDDANPNFYSSRNTVEFSVYHDFGGRSYILAVVLDLAEQVIWVSVY